MRFRQQKQRKTRAGYVRRVHQSFNNLIDLRGFDGMAVWSWNDKLLPQSVK